MVKFCSECGTKAEYKFSPPKFCSNCGASMGEIKVEPRNTKNGAEKRHRKPSLKGRKHALATNKKKAENDDLGI